ncbi:sodium-coupled monocarboxylate transporter 2-like [Macrobrachium nipponense]|uniref:sodium-coupled monocarboxylate transporter 2-like n=1 Tax=Macrobrachium nipponense TaxID=159736 RepID=UPI0030C7F6B8
MNLGDLDIAFFSISLLASCAIGVYYGVRGLQSTPLEYLLGGRSMKPFPLAMSMVVGTVSAVTIMGSAGEMYANGTQLWVMDLGIAIGMLIVAEALVPIMYPLQMVSLYQYIESRFKSKSLRQATVVLQLFCAYFFIGFVLYPPSIALKYFTGLPIIINIFIMGVTCTVYSAFGGVKAVVYADVFQALVMVIGVLAIVIQGSLQMGGLDHIWDIAYHGDRIEFFNFALDPYQRHSFWLCLTYGIFFALSTYGVNQSQTQRFFSTDSVKHAQWVLYYAAAGMVFLRAIINLAGLVMYAYFQDCDPLTDPNNVLNDPSIVVINYVLEVLTKIPGMSGAFVAAIYAAVLSSVSTQLNSMAALLWEDFLKEIRFFSDSSEITKGRIQKVLVLISGVLGLLCGFAVSQMGSFFRTLLTINGAMTGPLIGLFLVAVYFPWINAAGAAFGFVISIIMNAWFVVGQLFTLPPAKYLPLSRDGCPSPSSLNVTTIANFNLTTAAAEIMNITTTAEPAFMDDDEDSGRGLYALSYCLNSVWGTLICTVIAIIVTAVTGTNGLDDIDKRLVDAKSWALFERITVLQGREPLVKSVLRRSSTAQRSNSYNKGDTENPSALEELSPDGVGQQKVKNVDED